MLYSHRPKFYSQLDYGIWTIFREDFFIDKQLPLFKWYSHNELYSFYTRASLKITGALSKHDLIAACTLEPTFYFLSNLAHEEKLQE